MIAHEERPNVAERALRAASETVERHGPAELSMASLAERVGVSRATLYRHVGSRAELLAQVRARNGGSAVQEPVDTERRILEAARRVYGRRGLSAGTVEEVADEAGVGVATIYRRFGDREGLLRAFAQTFAPRAVARALADGGELRAVLERVAASGLRFLSEHADLLLLSLSPDPEARRLLRSLRQRRTATTDRLAAYLNEQMEAGRLRRGDATLMATAFTGQLLMLAVIAPLHQGRPLDDVDATARQLVTWFLDGAQRQAVPETKGGER